MRCRWRKGSALEIEEDGYTCGECRLAEDFERVAWRRCPLRFFPSSDEEGWPRHQKNIATASLDAADGVVSTRRNYFLANTTPSALARSHPASAEAGKARNRNPLGHSGQIPSSGGGLSSTCGSIF